MNKLWLGILLLSFPVWSAEDITVCAKYRNNWEWSNGHIVQARTMTSSELNQTRSGYYSYGHYVVIFGDNGEATVIMLEGIGNLSLISQEGEDKEGKKWEIRKGEYCF